jgi:hypothetical protein
MEFPSFHKPLVWIAPNKTLQQTAATGIALPGHEVIAVAAAAELGRSAPWGSQMPSLLCFLDEVDVALLMGRLNDDPEIAFIVADGLLSAEEAYCDRRAATIDNVKAELGEVEGFTFYALQDTGYRQRWKAVHKVASLVDGEHCLWHVPGGSLPLLAENNAETEITHPWSGWTEKRPGADPTVPYFGPGHHAVIRLSLATRHRPYTEEEKISLPVLNSHWNGETDLLVISDFQWIGDHYAPPPSATLQWWERLRSWLDRSAVRISPPPQIIWAFPSTLEKLRSGMAYDARGWDVSP